MNGRRRRFDHLARTAMGTATAGIAVMLLAIVGSIAWQGIGSLSWEMVCTEPEGGYYFGKGGGILNAIVGSGLVAGGATVLAVFLALPMALLMNVRPGHASRRIAATRFLLDVLWGIPSIVFGAFGFTVMLAIGLQTSLLAGIITVALLVTPIMARAMDEVLRTIPLGLLEASASLGSTPSETAVKVFCRQALPGLCTAVLLAFGRGIGDAASVLFTAGYTDHVPSGLLQPAATLPLAIFFQLTSPIPEVRDRAFAAAVVLTVIILVISLMSRSLSSRLNGHSV